jgi:cell division protein FtsB
MTDNPLSALIQLCLLTLLILAILLIMYMVINHKLVASQYKDNKELLQENKELREKLARYEQPQEPEWVQYLFNDQPSDPAISALN